MADVVELTSSSKSQLQLLEAAIGHMTEAVIIMDPATLEVVYMNDAAARLTGYEVSELIGQAISVLHGPQTERTIIEKLYAAMQRGEAITVETYNYRKDESAFICNWSTSPLHNEQGQIINWISIRRDVTEQRRAEEELLHARKLGAVGELAGGIAHEFKNLLTPMLLQIQSVMDDLADRKELIAELDVVKEAATKARDLSERVLMLGKKAPMKNEWQSLAYLIDENLKLISKTVDRKIEFAARLEKDLPNLWICKFSFSQIMLNLIFNARDTLQEKVREGSLHGWIPRITVALEHVGAVPPVSTGMGDRPIPCQRFAIEDNGKGIPIHIRDRMFEPFFTTKMDGQGNGLGLSLVWNLVHAMGGWIQVQSVPGIGTRMLVFFPEVTNDLLADAEVPVATAPEQNWNAEGKKLLLVEDEPIVARSLSLQLKRSGFEVTLAPNGREGLEMVKGSPNQWEVIVSDLSMPQMDGADFIKHIRETAFAGKVLVISGFISQQDKERLQSAKVDLILQKPISKEELLSALKRLLVV